MDSTPCLLALSTRILWRWVFYAPAKSAAVPVPSPDHAGEPIILDGSNIARGNSADDSGFVDLMAMDDALTEAGWTVLVVVDASLRHRIGLEEREYLEERIGDGWVQVPKGTDADVHILEEAQRLGAWVVSADQFTDHAVQPQRRLDPGLLVV